MVVDVDRIRLLKTNIARQLYTHLAYRFFVEWQEGDKSWTADYDWLAIHLGIKRWAELWRAKQQLHDAHEELKELGYIADYSWDGWRVTYRPGAIWKGEQLRRESGKARMASRKPLQSRKLDEARSGTHNEPHDPMIPALAAFASGLTVGEDRIRAIGLTIEQARTLCAQKNIPLRNPR
jgi:hypothetical protein